MQIQDIQLFTFRSQDALPCHWSCHNVVVQQLFNGAKRLSFTARCVFVLCAEHLIFRTKRVWTWTSIISASRHDREEVKKKKIMRIQPESQWATFQVPVTTLTGSKRSRKGDVFTRYWKCNPSFRQGGKLRVVPVFCSYFVQESYMGISCSEFLPLPPNNCLSLQHLNTVSGVYIRTNVDQFLQYARGLTEVTL